MISVEEAIDRIHKRVKTLPVIHVPLKEALGGVIGQGVISTVTFPPFDQSAMDGYAVNGIDLNDFDLIGEIKAGDDASSLELEPGQACRIFTGAMVPDSAEAVVKQEEVQVLEHKIRIEKQIKLSENVRKAGEQLNSGDMVVSKGTNVNAGAIAYCAMLGIAEIPIYRKPKIVVITTGSELVKPENVLKPGQIYDSNSVMLETSLLELGYDTDFISLKDDLESTIGGVKEALDKYDVVLLTGGISVGDYDFVHKAMDENGVEEVFYKVKQKPGKPLYFGMKGETVVFGLPGNPASVLTCFHIYVLEALRKLVGIDRSSVEKEMVRFDGTIRKMKGKTHFLKAYEKNGTVEVLGRQSSAMLGDFVQANCFIIVDEAIERIENESVEIIRLPKPFLF